MIDLILFGSVAGLVGLFAAPMIAKSLGAGSVGARVGNIYATVAMQTLGQPGISVSPNTDLSLRKRLFDADYAEEKIDSSGKTKRITKTTDTVHRWGSRPFTFIDERWGSTFDLRDVLFGTVEHQRRLDGDMVKTQMRRQGEKIISLDTYVRAVLDLGGKPRSLSMDLDESIRPITDGAEDADAWERVYEGVKRMFLPKQKGIPLLKMLMPMLAVVGGLFAGFYLFGPGALPGSSGGGTSIGVGASLPFFSRGDSSDDDEEKESTLKSIWDRLKEVETTTWKLVGSSLLFIPVLLIGPLVSPIGTLVFVISALSVALLIPIGSVLVGPILPLTLSEPAATGWMILALKAFDDPIIYQTQKTYDIVEADDIGAFDDDGTRHRFCKSWVGFSCDLDPEMFGPAGVNSTEIREYRTAIADGGDSVGPDYVPTTEISNAGHKGFLPASGSIEHHHTYVRTDRWLSRFNNASTGTMTEKAQKKATKDFAAGEPGLSDKQIMIVSTIAFVLSLGFSAVIFGGI